MFRRGALYVSSSRCESLRLCLPQIQNARALGRGNKCCAEILHFGLVGDAIWMLQPYYEGGTLKDVLESTLKGKSVTEDIWMRWAGELLTSVQSLHRENVRFLFSCHSSSQSV